MPTLISGKILSRDYEHLISLALKQFPTKPGLAMILVGNNLSSQFYINTKKIMCQKLGITSYVIILEENISQNQLTEQIQQLNENQDIHGILLQLPLPDHLKANEALLAIDPIKDVDGLHPRNIGLLCQGNPYIVPCTPQGCLQLIHSVQSDITGMNAVVLGRSILVGKPMALLLCQYNASVTILHSKSKDIEKTCKNADILIAAIGKPGFITPDFINPSAIIIDVGITAVEGMAKGDVLSREVGKAITPVPGGVGPMTVINLMLNTVKAYCAQNDISIPQEIAGLFP